MSSVEKKVVNVDLLLFVFFSSYRDSTVSARNAKAISENEIVDSLPADESERSGRLLDLAMDSLTNFMESHSLEVKLPKETPQQIARAIETGRGKLKKLAGPLLMTLAIKLISFVPLFLGGLIFLAIKALVVSKIAFILAAILGFQKFGAGGSGLNLLSKVSNGVGGYSSGASTTGWPSGSGISAQYPYARNYDTAQDLAYNAYAGEVAAAEQ